VTLTGSQLGMRRTIQYVPNSPAATTHPMIHMLRSDIESHTAAPPMPAHINTSDHTFAVLGMLPSPSSALKNGPKSGVRINAFSSLGIDLAKHQHARIKNTVVGMPGTTTPTAPNPTQRTPADASKAERSEESLRDLGQVAHLRSLAMSH